MKSRIIRHSTAIGATFGTTLGIAAGLTASFCSLLVYVLNSEVSLKPTLKDKFVFAGSGGLIPLFTFYGFRFGRKIGRKFAGRHVKQNATPYWTIEKKRKLYHFAIKVCTHKVTVTSTGIVISAMAANALYEKVDKALAEGWLTKRDHTKSRRISEESFKRLVRRECRISAKKKSSIAIDWSEKFRKLKYETKLENMNLSAFSEKELQFFKSTKFKNFTFSNCHLPPAQYVKCIITDCDFPDHYLTNARFNDCIIFMNTQRITGNLRNLKNNLKNYNNLIIDATSNKSLVLVLYIGSGSTRNTDNLSMALANRNITIIKVDSTHLFSATKTPDHPVTLIMDKIDGIVLPGGPDLPRDEFDYQHREKMECYLFEKSLELGIPLLAVCRGHQFVGQRLGGQVSDMRNRHTNKIKVINAEKSHLFQVTERKYQNQLKKNKSPEIVKTDEHYSYSGTCMHHQHVFFKPAYPELKHHQAIVTAVSEEGVVEGLQIRDHIITFQHHHESSREYNKRIGKAVLKLYTQLVVNYHNRQKNNDADRYSMKKH